MLACSPLPGPVWTPRPVVPNPFGDAFEVAAAVLTLDGGAVIYPGSAWTETTRKKAFADPARLAELRRQRPDATFGIRLGVGGGVIAIEHPGSPDAVFRLAELCAALGDLPATVDLIEGSRRWHLLRLPKGAAAPRGRFDLGDGIGVLGNGRGLPLPPSRTAWAEGAAPGEMPVACLPWAWTERLNPVASVPTVRWF